VREEEPEVCKEYNTTLPLDFERTFLREVESTKLCSSGHAKTPSEESGSEKRYGKRTRALAHHANRAWPRDEIKKEDGYTKEK